MVHQRLAADSRKTKEELLAELRTAREELALLRREDAPSSEPGRPDDPALYRALFDGSMDAIVVSEADTGRIAYANRAAQELTGYALDELVGMSQRRLHPPESANGALSAEFRQHLRNQDSTLQTRIVTARGVYRDVAIKASLVDVRGERYMIGVFRDITQERRTREDLEKIFALSPDLICIADIRTNSFIRVNPASTNILGYAPEEIGGRAIHEFTHPDDITRTEAVIEAKLRKGEEVINFQNRYRRKDGTYRWLNWVSHPIPQEGRTYAVARDITEAKKAEEALRDSERRFSSLYQAMIEGVALHEVVRDERGEAVNYRILDVNPKFEEILGISLQEAQGSLATDLYGVDQAPYLDRYAAVAQGAPPSTFDTYFDPLDKYFRISVFSNLPDQFATVFEDVTEPVRMRRQLEQSLAELSRTKLLLEALMQQAPLAMAVAKAPERRLIMVNPACRELLGIAMEERLEGREIFKGKAATWQLLTPEGATVPDEQRPFALALRGEPTHGRELRLVRADGTERWVVAYGSPIVNEQGELIAGLVTLADITEAKKTQEFIIQTEKMMSIGGLAAGMAHEINNPLSAILQGAQGAIRRFSPGLPGNVQAAERHGIDLAALQGYLDDRGVAGYLEGIQAAGARAADIVRNMLNFSRKSESQKIPSQLNDLLDNALDLASTDYDLKKQYDFKMIDVVRNYTPDLPLVPATRTELEQVFLNLIKNAAQALAETTAARPRPQIRLLTWQEGAHVCVRISDNGPGMDAEKRKRVFEPFYTSKPTGTGLGLSVSYFIVTRNHGGTFSVDSSPGHGASFTIRLPVPEAHPATNA